ncbi:hypothetical protein FQN49_000726 [Arthroderma sp. PD_2]|nr:hypothetical protein FQN49_000726 [Arthroderma sp. PD_2]
MGNLPHIVCELINIIQSLDDGEKKFRKAIETAKNPDTGAPETLREFGIETLEDYYKYLTGFLRWVPHENSDGREVHIRMCVMYFILDQPSVYHYQTPRNLTTTKYTRGELSEISQWIVAFAQDQGAFLDEPHSINDHTLRTFAAVTGDRSFRLDDYVRPTNGWKSFNDFFTRKVKPGKRPISDPTNEKVVASPADCRFWSMEHITEKEGLYLGETDVKGISWPIKDLLSSTGFEGAFKNGSLVTTILAVFDYHRFHSPVAGEVLESKVIPTQAFFEVKGDGKRLAPIGRPRHPGYPFCQTRGVVVLKTKSYGLVAFIPVGMGQISSVVLNVDVGFKLQKGEEIGYFQFGGSAILLVFEEKSGFKPTESVQRVKDKYDMGQQLGTFG